MADVKWIKITTDMFDNRKIKHLRKLPDGNSIVLIWVMLLTMAGKCNAGGMIFLTENIPYTTKMLADELEFEENTVKLALSALQQFGMIVYNEEMFAITGWGEHQNVDGLDKIREQNRLRQAKHKKKQKLLAGNSTVTQGNVTDNVTVTQGNATDIDKEEEKIRKERESEEENNYISCGEYENVIFTEKEFEKLKNEFPSDYQDRIENLSSYMASEGKTYSNHLATIRRWAKNEKQQQPQPQKSSQSTGNPFLDLLQDDFEIYEGVAELT